MNQRNIAFKLHSILSHARFAREEKIKPREKKKKGKYRKRRRKCTGTNRVSLVVVEAVVAAQCEPSPHPLVRVGRRRGFPPEVSGTERHLVASFLRAGPGDSRRQHVARSRHFEFKDVGAGVRQPHHFRMRRVHHALPVHRHYNVANFQAGALGGRVRFDRGNDHRLRAVNTEAELTSGLPFHHHLLVALCNHHHHRLRYSRRYRCSVSFYSSLIHRQMRTRSRETIRDLRYIYMYVHRDRESDLLGNNVGHVCLSSMVDPLDDG